MQTAIKNKFLFLLFCNLLPGKSKKWLQNNLTSPYPKQSRLQVHHYFLPPQQSLTHELFTNNPFTKNFFRVQQVSENAPRPPGPGGGIGVRRRPREGARAPGRRQRLRRTGQTGDGVRAPNKTDIHTHATRRGSQDSHTVREPSPGQQPTDEEETATWQGGPPGTIGLRAQEWSERRLSDNGAVFLVGNGYLAMGRHPTGDRKH